MNGFRSTPSRTAERPSLDALSRTIEGLEARIESLMAGVARQKSAEALRAERAAPRAADPRPADLRPADPLAEIRLRQRMLEESRERTRREREARLEAEREAARASAAPPVARPDDAARHDRESLSAIRTDMARLAGTVARLDEMAGASQETGALKAEIDALRQLVEGLAREETVLDIGHRIGRLEEDVAGLDLGAGARALEQDFLALASRIEALRDELHALDAGPALRLLDDKLLAIAEALEGIGRHLPGADLITDHFSGLDRRLDEISRAIAASGRTVPAGDADTLYRLEDRVVALGTQLAGLADRQESPLPALDDLGARMDRMANRLDELAERQAAARMEERLAELSHLMERSQAAPPPPELTGFLSDIARKIDALDQQSDAHVDRAIDRIEDQLGLIAARLDETAAAPAGDQEALRGLERQIAHLAELLNSGPGSAALQPLESRIAVIEESLATNDDYIIEAARQAAEAVVEAYGRTGIADRASAADMSALSALAEDLRQLEELSHTADMRNAQTFDVMQDTLMQIVGRLDDIDRRLRTEIRIPEAAPAAAAEPVRKPVFHGEMRMAEQPARRPEPALAGAEDGLARPTIRTVAAADDDIVFVDTDERMAATSEAAAPAATAAAPRKAGGLLARLTGRLKRGTAARGKDVPAEPAMIERALIDQPPPIDPIETLGDAGDSGTELLEPGSGAPDIKKILERVRANQSAARQAAAAGEGDRADYIAAARRAAQAAAEEVEASRPAARGKPAKTEIRAPRGQNAPAAGNARIRRPVLMAAGAILLVIMALPLVNTLLGDGDANTAIEPATVEAGPSSDPTTAAAPTAPAASAPAKPVAEPAPAAPKAELPPAASAPADATKAQAPVAEAAKAATAAAEMAKPAATAPLGLATVSGDSPDLAASVPATGFAVPAEIQPKSLADAARGGDPVAFFEIASRYVEGRGVKTDMAEAARWYQRAADGNLAPALYRLANLYEKGTGVTKDTARATTLYRRAADMGNASAMHNLAVMSATGAAGSPDYKQAFRWFRQAADLGVADSQFNLAILYARGNGTGQDLAESYKWFAIAAKDGDKDAAEKRDEVARAMAPEQLADARARTDSWKPKPLVASANSVNLPDEWTGEKTDKTASVDMKKAIRNIQAILNNNGFDAGQPDGEMGAKTVAAIKAFQKKIGLPVDGKVSDALVKALLARNS